MEAKVELWMLIPFGVMLLTIAVAPLLFEHWWEKNRNKLIFTLLLSIPTVAFLCWFGMSKAVTHQMLYDYVPFIMLLLALFVVTGGIRISGDISATPAVNTSMLAIGWMLASFMGTTGAAMLMIRPLLQINQQRKHRVHTVLFFIALVANCGGLLTPLGDPPLFLLYLRGAEFTWFTHALLPQWAFVGVVLLIVYAVWDMYLFRREPLELRRRDEEEHEPIRIKGSINFLWLAGVIAAVVFLNRAYIPEMADHHAPLYVQFLREIVLLALVVLSLLTTKRAVRHENHFEWGPIAEVAILFVGIFVTMTPALRYLGEHAGALGLTEPWQFYYATGTLSSFLDNAPTAVALHQVAVGLGVSGPDVVANVPAALLKAIALGSVFFGAMTYIGNGPNFMVKAIAESEGVQMPSFFGYMIRFSLIVLLPIYILVQLIFL